VVQTGVVTTAGSQLLDKARPAGAARLQLSGTTAKLDAKNLREQTSGAIIKHDQALYLYPHAATPWERLSSFEPSMFGAIAFLTWALCCLRRDNRSTAVLDE
jgi:hypothetical protein